MSKYDWPPTEGLVALCRSHGIEDAARRLAVPSSTLRRHLRREGLDASDWQRERQSFSDDVLKEIHALIA